MRWKQLTPSAVRRCAVFLALGGAFAVGNGKAEGGIASVESSQGRAALFGSDSVATPAREVKDPAIGDHSANQPGPLAPSPASQRLENPATSPDDLAGPGITGGNWFAGLQQGVDEAFEPQQTTAAAPAAKAAVASPLSGGVKANAIPSLPSFWSGLTCCVAVVVAGMIPRVRRALR